MAKNKRNVNSSNDLDSILDNVTKGRPPHVIPPKKGSEPNRLFAKRSIRPPHVIPDDAAEPNEILSMRPVHTLDINNSKPKK